MDEMNLMDLCQLSNSLWTFELFGNSNSFQKKYLETVIKHKDRLSLRQISIITKGLAYRNIYNEEFFDFIFNYTSKNIDELTRIENKNLADALAMLGKGYEIPFLNKEYEERISEKRISDKYLF